MGLLRLSLAMAVLLGHLPIASYQFVNAAVAVQGFYIISGFYMALVLDGKYSKLGRFYSNRLLRLAPTYFVVMVIAAAVLWGLNASATGSPEIFAKAFANPTTALVMAFENVAIVGQELLFWVTIAPDGTLVFDPSGALPNETTTLAWQALLVPQAWSLSIELMFYAVAPFIVRLHWQNIALIAAASLSLRFAGLALDGVSFGLWAGRFFPTVLFLFLMGVLAYKALPLAARLPKVFGWVLNAAILAAVVALPLSQVPAPAHRWIVFVGIAVAAPFLFHAFKDNALDRWIGDLSYPLYLCHLVVIGLVLTYEPHFAMWVAIAGALALSITLLHVVEHPVDRWRQRRAQGAGSAPTLGAPYAAREA